ncbi:MAG TPA: RluA family pseudouridine synthase [Thermoanaerobaculia bacterium]|jgi:RluA family pseudouridine synthase
MKREVPRPAVLLDQLSEMYPESSKTTLRQLLQTGRVRVNGGIEKNAKLELVAGDEVEVTQKSSQTLLPNELSILYEDGDVIVVYKANGLLTVATERERETTAQAYLNQYVGARRGQERIQVVHRLDRETSGVLLFAKNAHARERLKEQFAEHTIDRLYVALIEGRIDPPRGTIESWLRERRDLKMVSGPPHPEAKLAITHYETVKTNAKYSMLEVRLETGRKNQIRAHLSEAGHPVLGDRMYGSEVNPIARLALHAKRLGFEHPVTGKKMLFESAVPTSFSRLMG